YLEETIVNDNKLQEFEDENLEETIVNDNESQEFEDESMIFKSSDIDKSEEENSTVFGLKVGDKFIDWELAKRQSFNLEEENQSDNNDDIKFVEDNYKSSMLNLNSMMQYLDLTTKEIEIHNKQSKDETLNISNPYQIHIKGALKKYLKSALEDVSTNINKQYN
ncbi:30318_t:CDS:2, partial [Racocetra persica]